MQEPPLEREQSGGESKGRKEGGEKEAWVMVVMKGVWS